MDVLLIDADHSYEGLGRDYNAWLPNVKSPGKIIFHDYSYGWRNGSKRYIDEVVSNDPRVEFWEFGGVSALFVKK